MSADLSDCPCSGKNMSYFAAPWVLLTLYKHDGTHGYEINKFLHERLQEFGISQNITGLYRHLKAFEHRGILISKWDTPDNGPAKRKYHLTELGKDCLLQWMQTLHIQLELISKFLESAGQILPSSPTAKLLSRGRRPGKRQP
jgi:PadR family transcriptional regulator, regulatory protein PadR